MGLPQRAMRQAAHLLTFVSRWRTAFASELGRGGVGCLACRARGPGGGGEAAAAPACRPGRSHPPALAVFCGPLPRFATLAGRPAPAAAGQEAGAGRAVRRMSGRPAVNRAAVEAFAADLGNRTNGQSAWRQAAPRPRDGSFAEPTCGRAAWGWGVTDPALHRAAVCDETRSSLSRGPGQARMNNSLAGTLQPIARCVQDR